MNISLFGIPSILGGKKRSVKVNSDYPSTNNRLSHWYLSGSENPGANHVCASQRELMHKVWSQLLDDDFVTAYTHGFVIKCLDGKSRRFYPRILAHMLCLWMGQ